MGLREYLFRTDQKGGKITRYSRFDTLLSVVLAFALMFGVVFTKEGIWTPPRAALFGVVAVFVWLFAQHLRAVVGAATSMLTARMILGVLIGNHAFEAAVFALVLGSISWWLLKGCD